jgi:hypothetical protein
MPPINKGSIDPDRIVAAVIAVRERRRRADVKTRAAVKTKSNGVAVPESLE